VKEVVEAFNKWIYIFDLKFEKDYKTCLEIPETHGKIMMIEELLFTNNK
jgi:hypothetical protein